MTTFKVAKLTLKEPEKDLGNWEFVDLPKEGDFIGMKINDVSTAFRVDGIIHSPVQSPAISQDKIEIPKVHILVSVPQSSETEEEA